MKTKAKLTLAISALSAVVLAAGITSSYAWFTTQATAKFTSGTLTVDTISSLNLSLAKIGYDSAVGVKSGDGSREVVTNNEPLGAVSSKDGWQFVAPTTMYENQPDLLSAPFDYVKNNKSNPQNLTEYPDKWNTSYTNQHINYVKYAVKITSTKETTARDLKYGVQLKFGDGVPAEVKSAFRVAVYTINETTAVEADLNSAPAAAKVKVFATATSAVGTYVTIAEAGGLATSHSDAALTAAVADNAGEDDKTPYTLKEDFTGAASPAYTIAVAMWYEGTAGDSNIAGGYSFAPVVNFKLV